MYYAACSGKLDIMRLLLEAGVDPNTAASYGETALCIAACCGQLDIVRLLLGAGVDPNVAETKTGNTPLMMAAYSGTEAALNIMRLLLEAAAKPNVADMYSGETPLMIAVKKGEEAAVRMLLSHGANANAANSCGQTSLYYAARSVQLDIMRLLLEVAAKPNVANTDSGETPLMMAALRGSEAAMITHLLKHGADPNLVDCNKRTPLAIIGSQAELRRYNMRAALVASVVQAATALLQTCESAGVLLQVNTRDSRGNTPLHSFCTAMLACEDDVYARQREGCVQIVHALLFNHGAHVDVVNALGETPYKLWRRIYPTRFRGIVESNDEIHGRMSAQYHSLKCHCARLIVRHSIAYENRLPSSLIEFVILESKSESLYSEAKTETETKENGLEAGLDAKTGLKTYNTGTR
ncbi:PREDICTED: putative ankyrin repeat protein RF_0381 [Priapulus caudatus]|uniref:Ankyrin repeat domain-containing protein 54 n=1 Tax=Priapulus caudatus TaxID=37621 RepID=A0ABM1E0L4_PRICU|nr:PREDICTED: putative ankyrin repeat protein RF_0381 [Priapulus caudatus]